jgi:hypothetical protein
MDQINFKEIIRSEFKKCAADPEYFMKRYCYIQEPKRGRILANLFPYQSEAIHDIRDEQFNIYLKARQTGLSTVVALYSLWLMLFHKDKSILVIATKQETAKNLITKVQFAYDQLPVWLRIPATEKHKLSLKLENGSFILASSAAGDAGRSFALSLLILDEAAFIKNAHEIWIASQPALSTGGHAVLISTPNGVGNFFHKVWTAATEGNTDDESLKKMKFKATKIDWTKDPRRNPEWRDEQSVLMGERESRQEFDAEFLGSGLSVFDDFMVEEIRLKDEIEPLEKTGFDGNLWRWQYADPGRSYIVSADVARGDAADYSTFHVIDVESCEQVVEYRGKIGTTQFAHMLMAIAMEYGGALLIVERENHGWAVIQEIINHSYPNLFYMSKDRQVVEIERNLTNRYNQQDKQLVPGFSTSVKTRPLIINRLDTYMREDAVRLHSKRTFNELRTFIWENGKAQAQEGYNDDLIMALCIGLWVRDTAMKLHQEGQQITKAALDGIRRTEQPFQGMYTPNHMMHDPFKMTFGQQPNGSSDDEDLRWLIS